MLNLSKSELWTEVKRLGRQEGVVYQRATKAQLIALLTPPEKPAAPATPGAPINGGARPRRAREASNLAANKAIAGARRATSAEKLARELAARDAASLQALTEACYVHLGIAASSAAAVHWPDLALVWRRLQKEFADAFTAAARSRTL